MVRQMLSCSSCNFCNQQILQDELIVWFKQESDSLVYDAKNKNLSSDDIKYLLNHIKMKKDNLKKLSIDCQNSHFYRTFPSRLLFSASQVTGLKELILRFPFTAANSLGALKKIQQIAPSLRVLSLNFQETNISLIDYHTICETIQRLKSLSTLEVLISKILREKNIRPLSEALRGMTSIQNLTIDFQNNASMREDMFHFFLSLRELKTLCQLRVNIKKSSNCTLSDEDGLCCRWLFITVREQLEVLEFSALETSCDSHFWLNFFSGLRQINFLKVLSLQADFLYLDKSKMFLNVLSSVFFALSKLICLQVKSQNISVVISSILNCKFLSLHHISFLQKPNMKEKTQNNSKQLEHFESKDDLLFIEFLVNNFFALQDFQYKTNVKKQIFYKELKLMCVTKILELIALQKYITPLIDFHQTLITWDLFY